MTGKEKISVVVPIYNVEDYLPRCLDTLISQTYSNIEIMLVDDGSPDNAGAICDKYAENDSRIRVFHIPNGGVAKARQYGVESSTGDYIVFVDPDDWLPLDSIEILYSHMTDDVDIVSGAYTSVRRNSQIMYNVTESIITDYTKSILLYQINTAPWGKLYRRCLFDEDSFPQTKRSQDTLMCLEISVRVRAVKTISESVMYYFIRESSVSNQFTFDVAFTKLYGGIVLNFLNKNNIFEKYHSEYCSHILFTLILVIKCNKHIDKKDPWVANFLAETEKATLIKKSKFILTLVKYPLFQSIFRVLRQCKLLLMKIRYGRMGK